jgi:hypothetical protein
MKEVSCRFIKCYFLAAFILVIFNAGMFGFLSDYRNILGIVKTKADYAVLAVPTVGLILFYGRVCFKLFIKGEMLSRKFLINQSIFFSVVALFMCVPFIGYYLALITPIGVIYLSSILLWSKDWPLNWYYFSSALCLVFVFINLLLAKSKGSEKIENRH